MQPAGGERAGRGECRERGTAAVRRRAVSEVQHVERQDERRGLDGAAEAGPPRRGGGGGRREPRPAPGAGRSEERTGPARARAAPRTWPATTPLAATAAVRAAACRPVAALRAAAALRIVAALAAFRAPRPPRGGHRPPRRPGGPLPRPSERLVPPRPRRRLDRASGAEPRWTVCSAANPPNRSPRPRTRIAECRDVFRRRPTSFPVFGRDPTVVFSRDLGVETVSGLIPPDARRLVRRRCARRAVAPAAAAC